MMAKSKKQMQSKQMAEDKMEVLDKVNALLLRLEVRRIEWFLVLTNTEDQHDIRGSVHGEKFLEESRDVVERFTQYCRCCDKIEKDELTSHTAPDCGEVSTTNMISCTAENSSKPSFVSALEIKKSRLVCKVDNEKVTASAKTRKRQTVSSKTCAKISKKGSEPDVHCKDYDRFSVTENENPQTKTACQHPLRKKKKAISVEEEADQIQNKTDETSMNSCEVNSLMDQTKKSTENLDQIRKSKENLGENLGSDSSMLLDTESEVTENVKEISDEKSQCEVCTKIFSILSSTNNSKVQLETPKFDEEIKSLEVLKYRYHNSKHTVNDISVLTCPICNRKQDNIEDILKHFVSIHEKCTKIILAYSNIKEGTKENGKNIENGIIKRTKSKKASSSEDLLCPVCGLRVHNQYNLKRHIRRFHKEKTYLCAFCGRKFAEQFELDKHAETHVVRFECDIEDCGKKFSNETSFLAHKAKHDTKVNICSVCGKICPSKSKLNYHMKYHAEDRPLECEECGKSFKTKDVLTKHQRIHKSIRHFYCEICGRGFDQSGSMQRHLLVHTDLKPHKCSVCGVEYRTAAALKSHKLRAKHYTEEENMDVPTVKCNVCGKEFLTSLRHEYNRHLLTHSGEKPYPCTLCYKSFNDKSNLRQHIKIHKDDRPFQCPSCDKRFIQQRSLRKHLVLSGHGEAGDKGLEKPYQCDVSNASFIDSSNLQKYTQKVHEEGGPFSCSGCDKHFNHQQSLRKHQVLSGHCESHNKGPVDRIETDAQVQYVASKSGSSVSNFDLLSAAASHVEQWCNKTSADQQMHQKNTQRPPVIIPKIILGSGHQGMNTTGTFSYGTNVLSCGSSMSNSVLDSGIKMVYLDSNSEDIAPNRTNSDTGNMLPESSGYKFVTLNSTSSAGQILTMESCPQNMILNSGIILLKTNTTSSTVPLHAESNMLYTNNGSRNVSIHSGTENSLNTDSEIDALATRSSPSNIFQTTTTYSTGCVEETESNSENITQRTEKITQDTQRENSDLNLGSDSGQKILNINSDTRKILGSLSESENTLQNKNSHSDDTAMNTSSYEGESTFIDSPNKTHPDSENCLLNSNTDTGNIFMTMPNFLPEDAFSQSVYNSKPSTYESHFDPMYYASPTSQVLCPMSSVEVNFCSPSPVTSHLQQQDTKYLNMDSACSLAVTSALEQFYNLPFTATSADTTAECAEMV